MSGVWLVSGTSIGLICAIFVVANRAAGPRWGDLDEMTRHLWNLMLSACHSRGVMRQICSANESEPWILAREMRGSGRRFDCEYRSCGTLGQMLTGGESVIALFRFTQAGTPAVRGGEIAMLCSSGGRAVGFHGGR